MIILLVLTLSPRIDAASAAAQNFLAWVDTSPVSYLCDGDIPLSMVETPADVDNMKNDMIRTPKWIIKVCLPIARASLPQTGV